MNDGTPNPREIDGKPAMDVTAIIQILWKAKFLIILITALAACISVFYALSLPNIYTSKALLAPNNSQTNGLGGMARQFGGLASLAGINLSSSSGQETEVAIETLQSRRFFQDYIYEKSVVDLMAAESWDQKSNIITYDSEIYSSGEWTRKASYPRKAKPSVQEAYKEFAEILNITEDRQTGFISMQIEHLSPHVAANWLGLMIKGINDSLRDSAVLEAQKSIDFLSQQLEETQLINLAEVFAQLIEEQTKTMMLAYASDSYVFSVIDPPLVPELKTKPSRAFICIVGTLVGAGASIVIVLLLHLRNRQQLLSSR